MCVCVCVGGKERMSRKIFVNEWLSSTNIYLSSRKETNINDERKRREEREREREGESFFLLFSNFR